MPLSALLRSRGTTKQHTDTIIMHARSFRHTHTRYIHVHVYIYIDRQPHKHTHTNTQTTHRYVCVYLYIHTHIYIYLYLYVYMCVCVYVCALSMKHFISRVPSRSFVNPRPQAGLPGSHTLRGGLALSLTSLSGEAEPKP